MHHHSLYVALVVAHVVAAVVGFGHVGLSGVYAGTAGHPERPGAVAEAGRFFASSAAAEWALVAVPVLGFAAVALSGAATSAWVVVASSLWAGAALLVLAVVRPCRGRLRAALADDGGDGGDGSVAVATATRLARAAAAVDVLAVLAVLDMVYKPGG